ncbi:MAG: hypothetical protein GFGODING_00752 [Flavobacteriales bacterium]|nr:hypothetical protein [Flavobacteriales bacterium]
MVRNTGRRPTLSARAAGYFCPVMGPRRIGRILLGYFLRGLLLVVPATVLIWALWKALAFLDGIIPIDIPGVGLLTLLVGLTLFGWLGSTILYQPVAEIGEEVLKRIPFLKTFYGAIKDLVEAVVGNKRRFDRPVLVRLSASSDLERLGFITEDDLAHLGLPKGKVAVYMPHSFAWSGNLVIVPAANVTLLDARAADVMKFVVSGGVSKVDDDAS